MGRRKERRLAAMGATGRRVKLDLFAEPSGDLGGSSAQDEVGGEDDSKNRAGLPSSPSSSGQQLQNPLLLLGQYSDDEMDEGSRGDDSDDANGSSGDVQEQAKVDGGYDEGVGTDGANNSVSKKVEDFILEIDSLEKLEEDDNTERKTTDSVSDIGDMDLKGQAAPATCDGQVIADASSGWKMVLHEESNQYYYWNVVTGETSWEVPGVLSQTTNTACEDKVATDSELENAADRTVLNSEVSDVKVDNSTSAMPTDVVKGAILDCITNENERRVLELEVLEESYKNGMLDHKKEGDDGDRSQMLDSFALTFAHNQEAGDHVLSRPSGVALVGNGFASVGNSRHHGEHEAGSEFSSRLMKHCEYLLEMLRSVNRSKDELILKCTMEVQIRLNDLKSLASHGSSLLPFWVHSEKQLKQLEATIHDEILQLHKSVQVNEIEDAHNSDGSVDDDIKAGLTEELSSCPPCGDSHVPVLAGREVEKNSGTKDYNDGTFTADHVSSMGFQITYSACDIRAPAVDGPATQNEETPKTLLHSGEDADMDVDMEVDDAVPPDATDSYSHVPLEQPSLLSLPGYKESSLPGQMVSIPPPPDEDWIPPPPPDNEPFPPPPPEEPPETSYPPPPESESVHSFSYADQYNQAYPGSNFVYYGETNSELPSTNLYAYSEGSQVSIPQPSVYYESLQSTYSAVPVMVNAVEAGAYYGLPDTLVGGVDSSGVNSVSGHKSFDPDMIRSLNANSKADYTFLPKASVVDRVTAIASSEVSVSQAAATAAISEIVSAPSTSSDTAIAANSTAASKGQSKALRIKKRSAAVVSTLRSNKKVSSLVDKWKAAKEELHEDEEEEPLTYLEKLEKKRQREIEEWRAQQIASGEAKDNANFQPLVGDWRERVKRRRAQMMKERNESPSEGVTEGSHQPDLNELSKGLPTGWQAYWDDSSKQVYYGNAATSETSWIKPTT